MEPTLVVTPPTRTDAGHPLARGLKSVLVEHRLPYRVARWKDSLCRSVGWKHRTVAVDGLRFSVRRGTWADECILNHVVRDREYHPPGYEIRPGETVIDIGGNIGGFAVSAARAAEGGWVYVFEPEPDNFALLEHNLDRNHCHNVSAVRAAVTAAAGLVTLSVNADNSGGHSLHRDHGGPGVTVPAVTLHQIFDEYRIGRCDYLKIDCEGAEYDILRGLPQRYFARIRRLVLEYHGEPADKRRMADDLVDHLRGVGFRIDQYTDIVGSRGGLVFATNATETDTPRKPGRPGAV